MQKSIGSKPHYALLDGMRGVAALTVLLYHVFECFATTPVPHGHLAVDFFFVLSGFVIGYAYDQRWTQMSTATFFKRRLIRLHPMVVMGAIIGLATYLIQGATRWDGTAPGLSLLMLALLAAMFLIPATPGSPIDVRGNNEMFPLNGPSWSLFFEYIGNVLYALLLRRMPTKMLAIVAAASGVLLTTIAVSESQLGVGWSFIDGGFFKGLVRMLFPYSTGMLLARHIQKKEAQNRRLSATLTFACCSLAFIAIAAMPKLGSDKMPWANGLFEAFCVVAIFPLLVWLGSQTTDPAEPTKRLCLFIGNLSYPLYAVHYPLMYLFYHYIGFDGTSSKLTIAQVWPEAILLFAGSIALGWLCLKCYEAPVRKRLSAKLAP